jgi:hypothetical protein
MTPPYISIVVSSYKPGVRCINNSIRLKEIADNLKNDVEIIYLFNGSQGLNKKILDAITDNLSPCKNAKVIKYSENIGVGLAYQNLCEQASGKFIYCLADDDLISLNNAKKILSFLKKNYDIDLMHQLIDDETYTENHLFCGIHSKETSNYNSAFAYICHRYGALSGQVFSKAHFLEKKLDWKIPIYPWVGLAFEAYGKKIAIFDPVDRINVDPGPPAHKRFNDKVQRPYDYGFNERFAYRTGANLEVSAIFSYLTINWIGKIIKNINGVDADLAKKVSNSLRDSNNQGLFGIYQLSKFKLTYFSTTESFIGFWKWRTKR